MTHPISLSEAIVDIGDNQFLSHVTHEILIENKVIGHLLYTEYDWGLANDLKTARRWLDRDETYLGRLKKYLLDDSYTIATISDIISQGVTGPRKCIIIDDVSMTPFYMGLGIEKHVIRRLLKESEMKYSFAMCPAWDCLCDRMAIEDEDKVAEMNKLGLCPIDDYIMIRYLDDEMLNDLITAEA